ncbi:hypothetical protein LSH36_102g09023 [Paralvinella palmiformis]|uniref:Uncharacterized protein n=1 Tax=Paralvinella palmiformis TaxID=53620 RepID=A0AAD9K0M3_9ANNE|nr:hypothetical protein LSH36_102g09023 [Paralvinella palmiformis]
MAQQLDLKTTIQRRNSDERCDNSTSIAILSLLHRCRTSGITHECCNSYSWRLTSVNECPNEAKDTLHQTLSLITLDHSGEMPPPLSRHDKLVCSVGFQYNHSVTVGANGHPTLPSLYFYE